MNPPKPWVIVGNPENRRVTLFQQALARQGHPPAAVLSYHGLLTGQESMASIPAGAIVRVESPGENFAVERLLLAAGAAAAEEEGSPFISAGQAEILDEDRGRILHPRQWYLGFMASCRRWFADSADPADWLLTTQVAELQVIFDKLLCHRRCSLAGMPVPRAIGNVSGWDELAARIASAGLRRVFVKLANGSSASGVVALQVRAGTLEAITSVELVRTTGELRLYNSLKIRRYTTLDDVRDLIDALAPHHVHAEEWLPKAAIDRRVCDLRVVVIAGEAKQIVVRTSRSPLTNLHLGNRRGDLSRFLLRLSDPQLESLRQTCRQCADVFPRSLHLGLDVLFTPGFRRHYLLEVNAFGDLLPGVLHQGLDTYETEIEATQRLAAWRMPRAAVVPATIFPRPE
jgi:glutathione synthase/RimK-type ligase-like ATP-grasp enzyme